MESRLHQEDADEWFYQSFTRYKNLYMFEFEAPVDTMDLINDTSLCTAGIQTYSKKCEILQLAIPPKLLPKEMEEGLCKDRDFKIISGGYSSTRILQIKPFKSEKLVAAVQANQSGVGLFHLGNDNHGVITELDRLIIPNDAEEIATNVLSRRDGVISTRGKDIIFGRGATDGVVICHWKLDAKEKGITYKLSESTSQKDGDDIDKIDFWDDNVIAFCSRKGRVYLYDVREAAAKASVVVESARLKEAVITSNQISSDVVYSFDTKPGENTIGVADSCGGLEIFDSRKPVENLTRSILPGCNSTSVLHGKFDLQFQKLPSSSSGVGQGIKFILTGFKDESVPVYRYCKSGEILPIFNHDGHTKIVTNALWHAISDDLVFSASIDSVLHAWQFVENEIS